MKPEEKVEIKAMIDRAIKDHRHTGLDSRQITGLSVESAPFANIADPSGGLTIDAEARTAINSILDVLEKTKLMQDQ